VIADYFIICSGSSVRLVKALVNTISDEVKKKYGIIPRIEGEADSGWMLVDCGDLIVHVFSPQQRDFYQLEDLWAEGKTLVRLQ
jgi:ribosome-associated protein